MNIDQEIEWSKLIIELYTQYSRQVYLGGNIEEASKTLEKLNKLKLVHPNVFEKVRFLKLNDIDEEYHTMAIIKEKAHNGLANCTGTPMLNINNIIGLLSKPLGEFERARIISDARKQMQYLSVCIEYFDKGTRILPEMESLLREILREICDGVTHMSWDRVQELSNKIENVLNK